MEPKAVGGLGFPNFRLYYYATHLARIIDWHCHAANKDWVSLEEFYRTHSKILSFSPLSQTFPDTPYIHISRATYTALQQPRLPPHIDLKAFTTKVAAPLLASQCTDTGLSPLVFAHYLLLLDKKGNLTRDLTGTLNLFARLANRLKKTPPYCTHISSRLTLRTRSDSEANGNQFFKHTSQIPNGKTHAF